MAGQWFFLGAPVSSINKTNPHDVAEILLKVALNTIIHAFILFLKNYSVLSLFYLNQGQPAVDELILV